MSVPPCRPAAGAAGRGTLLTSRDRLRLFSAAVVLTTAAGCGSRLPASPVAVRRPHAEPTPAASAPAPVVPDRGEAARAEIRRVSEHLTRSPQDSPARFQLANLYLTAHEPQHALRELRVLESRHPDAPELHLLKGIVLRVLGRPEQAERSARHLLSLHPEEEAGLVLLGDLYLDQRRSEEALKVFERCLKKHPESYGGLVGKTRALEQLFQSFFPVSVPEMIAPVEKAVRLEPDNPEGVILLARLTFSYRTQLVEAERLAHRGAELDPRSAEPSLLLAGIALSRPTTVETLRAAAQYAEEAARRAPKDPAPHYYLGKVHLQRDEPVRAVESLRKSIALRPLPEAVSELALAYRRTGNRQQAEFYSRIYRRYMELEGRRKVLLSRLTGTDGPNERRQLQALVELYVEAGQPEEAAAWLEELSRSGMRDSHTARLKSLIDRLRKRRPAEAVLRIP